MARQLSARAQVLLGDAPPYLAGDPAYQAVQSALGNEMQRVQDTADAIRAALIPVTAQDVTVLNGNAVAPMLSLLETLLGLPVNPAGVDLPTRRRTVITRIATRHSGSELAWVALIDSIIGTGWTYTEG